MTRATMFFLSVFFINLLPATAMAAAGDPTFGYISGYSVSPLYVPIACPTAGEILLITTDGSEPKLGKPAKKGERTHVYPSGQYAVLVRIKGTVKAACVDAAGGLSKVVSNDYTIGPKVPTLEQTFGNDPVVWRQYRKGCLAALVIGPKCRNCGTKPKAKRPRPRRTHPASAPAAASRALYLPPPAVTGGQGGQGGRAALNVAVPDNLHVTTEDATPIYRKWQFWVGVGAVVAAGATVGIVCGTGHCDGGTTTVTIKRAALGTF